MKRIRVENLIFIGLSLCLAAYAFTRAAMISITHDEVGTYLGYSIHPVMDIIRFTNLQLNNHLLNSLLVKLTTSVFGVSEFNIRLPNLVAYIFYLVFSWKIISLLTKDRFLMITGFILVNFNPYLLDFFSIGRGYGLEISFMAMSIFFLLRFQSEKKPVHLWLSVLFGALGVLSNFTFITFYFSMILLVNIFIIFDVIREKTTWKNSLLSILKLNLPVIIITIALAALIAGPLIRLESIGEFSSAGNRQNLWGSLFRSVIRHSLYGKFKGDSLHEVFKVLSVLCILLFAYFAYKDKWSILSSRYFLLFCLLLTICLWFFLQHVLLGSMYPQQRFALFLLPLFMLTLISALDLMISFRSLVIPLRSVLVIVSLLILIHFYNCANASYYFDWKYDTNTRQMLEENLDRMRDVSAENKRNVVFGTYWLYYPSLKYYLMVKNIDWINLESYRDTFSKKADLYYIPIEYKDSLNKFNPVFLEDYPQSGSALYK